MAQRIAVVVGLLFLFVAIGAVIWPAKPEGVECGSLVRPDWTDEQTDDLIGSARDIYERDFTGTLAGEAVGMAMNARRNNRLCNDARSTRTTVAIGSGAVAAIGPIAILFIAGGRRGREAS